MSNVVPIIGGAGGAVMTSPVLAVSGTPPQATAGVPYSWTPSITGAQGGLRVTLDGGLPNGLAVNSATGEVKGTPATSQTTNFGLTIRDDINVAFLPGLTITAAVLPVWLVAALGDSRVFQIHVDSAKRNRSAYNHYNWGNAFAGQRLRMAAQLGVSGDRTDQVLARLDAAINSGAGLLYLHAGTNDIGQNFPSASTSGATAWANLKTMADAGLAKGMKVILTLDPGASNMNATQIGQLLALNQSMRDYAAGKPNVFLFDLPAVVWDNPNPTTAITFKAGYYRAETPLTHEQSPGAFQAGKAFKTLIETIVPNVLPRTDGLQIASNAELIGTAGTKNAGITGTVATDWAVSRAGSATASATATGGTQEIAATFTASGETVTFNQNAPLANWSPGNVVELLCDLEVDVGHTGLAGIRLYLQTNGTLVDGGADTPVETVDLFPDVVQGPTEGYAVALRTERITIPAYFAKKWLTAQVRAYSAGAGNVTFRIRNLRLQKVG